VTAPDRQQLCILLVTERYQVNYRSDLELPRVDAGIRDPCSARRDWRIPKNTTHETAPSKRITSRSNDGPFAGDVYSPTSAVRLGGSVGADANGSDLTAADVGSVVWPDTASAFPEPACRGLVIVAEVGPVVGVRRPVVRPDAAVVDPVVCPVGGVVGTGAGPVGGVVGVVGGVVGVVGGVVGTGVASGAGKPGCSASA
jgi:hypothetical protein